MPTLNISIVIKGQLHANEDACRTVQQPMTKDHWLQVHQHQVKQILYSDLKTGFVLKFCLSFSDLGIHNSSEF